MILTGTSKGRIIIMMAENQLDSEFNGIAPTISHLACTSFLFVTLYMLSIKKIYLHVIILFRFFFCTHYLMIIITKCIFRMIRNRIAHVSFLLLRMFALPHFLTAHYLLMSFFGGIPSLMIVIPPYLYLEELIIE